MHGTMPDIGRGRHVRSASVTDQTDSDDGNDWFVSLIRSLLPKDAGFALHIITGFEERTCYRYANGDRKPPGYLLRQLLRSEHGAQFLAALMDGSDAQWWRDLERERRVGAAALAADRNPV